MNFRIFMLASACAITLVACGDKSPDGRDSTANAAPVAAESTTTMPPPAAPLTPTPTAASNGKSAAVVTDCATEIEGNDAMQFNVGSIMVPASCAEFTVTLRHTGKMPVAGMGHNVVVSKATDVQQATAAGISAGPGNGYVKPDDPNVIAHTRMVGGGETTSVSFAVSKIQGSGPYEFFCSFPGHAAIMKGAISVEQVS